MEKTVKIFTLDKKDETLIPLIRETFAKENIPIEIRSKYDTAYDGLFIGQKGLADIYVMKEDAERSLAILNDLLADLSSSL
jgi:hypothetical protein